MSKLDSTDASSESIDACYQSLSSLIPQELATVMLADVTERAQVQPATMNLMKEYRTKIENCDTPVNNIFSAIQGQLKR